MIRFSNHNYRKIHPSEKIYHTYGFVCVDKCTGKPTIFGKQIGRKLMVNKTYYEYMLFFNNGNIKYFLFDITTTFRCFSPSQYKLYELDNDTLSSVSILI